MQLVYCLACLAMAGWMWMRYSYAWPATLDGIIDERYELRVKGIKQRGQDHFRACAFAELTRPYLAVRAAVSTDYTRHGKAISGYFSPSESRGFSFGVLNVTLAADTPEGDFGVERTITGRLRCWHEPEFPEMPPLLATCSDLIFDTTASRLRPASIAGLVIGAMGCFIFGLYLRTWLGDRKTLARQPEQDMIG
jgi:hypothetical protein